MGVNFPCGEISGFPFSTFPKIEMNVTSRRKILERFYWTK